MLFVVTGATRGIGRALALELDRTYGDRATFLLVARDKSRLKSLKSELRGFALMVSTDFADPLKAERDLQEILATLKPQDFNRLILVNNAGVLVPVGHMGTLRSEEIERHIQINLVAPMILSNLFLSWSTVSDSERLIINISSGAARFPIVCWGPYCAGKAGVDMFSRTLAEENQSNLHVISVAPGVIETDMQKSIRGMDAKDFPRVNEFVQYKETGKLKTVEQSAKEIVRVIESPERFDVLTSL